MAFIGDGKGKNHSSVKKKHKGPFHISPLNCYALQKIEKIKWCFLESVC